MVTVFTAAGLFAYSRLEYLEQSPQRAPMDFSQLVAKITDDFRLRAEERHISVCVDGSADSCEIQGDWSFLARALGNLLDNALRYSPDGGKIVLHWRRENHLVRFTVADSGPGIAEEDLPHVFDPLYHAEASRNRQTGGAGLGLTIARRILCAHGGDLVAANRASGGAEFAGSFTEG